MSITNPILSQFYNNLFTVNVGNGGAINIIGIATDVACVIGALIILELMIIGYFFIMKIFSRVQMYFALKDLKMEDKIDESDEDDEESLNAWLKTRE